MQGRKRKSERERERERESLAEPTEVEPGRAYRSRTGRQKHRSSDTGTGGSIEWASPSCSQPGKTDDREHITSLRFSTSEFRTSNFKILNFGFCSSFCKGGGVRRWALRNRPVVLCSGCSGRISGVSLTFQIKQQVLVGPNKYLLMHKYLLKTTSTCWEPNHGRFPSKRGVPWGVVFEQVLVTYRLVLGQNWF